MALEQHALLRKESVPSRAEWQAAIAHLGFDLQLDLELKPFESSGFLPCTLAGKQSGFEIYYEPADEIVKAYPHLKEKTGSRHYSISFRWGGDMAEGACVMIASAALAKSFDAVLYYPDDDLLYSSDDLVRDAKECMANI
jgi:hypothetical protein